MTSRRCCCDEISCSCMSVTLSGLDNGTCNRCYAGYNGTYRLPSTGESQWGCAIPAICKVQIGGSYYSVCQAESLTLTYNSSTNVWTLVAFGVTWTAEGTECDSLNLSYDSDDGHCDGSTSSAYIHPYSGDDPCFCPCLENCPYCIDGNISPYLQVVISGLENDCTNECEDVNGTYILEFENCSPSLCACGGSFSTSGSGAYWRYSGNDIDFTDSCLPSCGNSGLEITFALIWNSSASTWTAYLSIGIVSTVNCSGCDNISGWSRDITSEFGTGDADCLSVDYSFGSGDSCSPSYVGAHSFCDMSGASAQVSVGSIV